MIIKDSGECDIIIAHVIAHYITKYFFNNINIPVYCYDIRIYILYTYSNKIMLFIVIYVRVYSICTV
jgi:hypothetical protein